MFRKSVVPEIEVMQVEGFSCRQGLYLHGKAVHMTGKSDLDANKGQTSGGTFNMPITDQF